MNWLFFVPIWFFLQLLLNSRSVIWAQQAQFADCTRNGGPDVVKEDTLRRASLGSLDDADIQLWSGKVDSGTLLSPSTVIEGTVDKDLRFTIFPSPSSEELFGYLVRIAHAKSDEGFEPFFLTDAQNVGLVSFCAALDLLVSSFVAVFSIPPANEISGPLV